LYFHDEKYRSIIDVNHQIMKALFFSLWIFFTAAFAQAQEVTPSPILFIYDASGSMWGQLDGKPKKEIASDVLSSTVNALSNNQEIGLMAYGHRRKSDCEDVEFIIDLSNSSKSKVNTAVAALNPLGKTPLAHSATLAINSLKDGSRKATIILITDGIESCDGNICEVVARAKEAGIEFKLHIVGFGLKDGESEQLECAAAAGDGNYYDAKDANGLSKVLIAATAETVDDPAGNLSIFATKNEEPVDAWVQARKTGTDEVVDASRTYRDSAWMYLPPGRYDISIQPLEGTDIPGTTRVIEMKEGEIKHEKVAFDGGTLQVMATNNGEGWDAMVKMYEPGTKNVVAQTRTYGRAQIMEVPAGIYKVTYQALAMKGMETFYEVEQVEVQANAVTESSHDFETGIAMIGVKTASGELVDATVNFIEINSGKNVAGSRTYTSENNNPREFLLNPGNYEVKIITLGVHKGHKETFSLTVKKGETVEKTIEF
jgi:Ca-activated chloride channel family protein